MGIPLRAGRDFTDRDRESSAQVIIDQRDAGAAPVAGRGSPRPDSGPRRSRAAGDRRRLRRAASRAGRGSGCEMYLPIRQTDDYTSVALVVRTTLPPAALASGVRTALAPLDPDVPANEFRTLQQTRRPRGLAAPLRRAAPRWILALSRCPRVARDLRRGSYSVSQRTQEIGIRMALGASEARLQASVVAQTLGLAAAGIGIGVTCAWLLARGLSGFFSASPPAIPSRSWRPPRCSSQSRCSPVICRHGARRGSNRQWRCAPASASLPGECQRFSRHPSHGQRRPVLNTLTFLEQRRGGRSLGVDGWPK